MPQNGVGAQQSTDAIALCSAPPHPPAPVPSNDAGVIVFPNGLALPAELQVPSETDDGEWVRGQFVAVDEFWNALRRQHQTLQQIFWKLRQRLEEAIARTQALRLIGLPAGQPNWMPMEKELPLMKPQAQGGQNRAPPILTKPADIKRQSSPFAVPNLVPVRAPNLALPLAEG